MSGFLAFWIVTCDAPCSDVRLCATIGPHAGDVDGRVSAGDDADEECERKVIDDPAAENEQRECRQKYRAAGDIVRLRVWFKAWLMMSLKEPRMPSFKSSRIRSKMTILSLMEKPMMVNTAATTVALNSRPDIFGDAITAQGQQHVVQHGNDRRRRRRIHSGTRRRTGCRTSHTAPRPPPNAGFHHRPPRPPPACRWP